VENFGRATIAYWEYLVLFFYLIVVYLYFARQKNLRIKTRPEYKWFIPGLFAKLFGAIFFSLIYFYYYRGGDTTAYFYSSVSVVRLLFEDPLSFLKVWLGDNTVVTRELFTERSGKPFGYLYYDDRQYMVVRLVTPFTFICIRSFLITTVVFSSVSYIGIWKLYQTLYRYFPRIEKQLAIAVLLMPSSVVWGSAILKDTITFSAFCWFIHAVDNLWFRRVDVVSNVVAITVTSLLMIWIKPYIFMVLLPSITVWLSYSRVSKIRNSIIKYMILPVVAVVMTMGIFLLLDQLGDQFGKFSLQNSLESIISTQRDLANNAEYGTNRFNVGELENNWGSVLSKFPVATTAALFRPFITECNNFVMVLSGLENLFILALCIRMLIRTRIIFMLSSIVGNPLVTTCFTFALLYGFVTGITTPNFGALVRFKIPLLPLFVAGMYIVIFLVDERKRLRGRGQTFRFENYRSGDPHVKRNAQGLPM
jgi:hypothetical protein